MTVEIGVHSEEELQRDSKNERLMKKERNIRPMTVSIGDVGEGENKDTIRREKLEEQRPMTISTENLGVRKLVSSYQERSPVQPQKSTDIKREGSETSEKENHNPSKYLGIGFASLLVIFAGYYVVKSWNESQQMEEREMVLVPSGKVLQWVVHQNREVIVVMMKRT